MKYVVPLLICIFSSAPQVYSQVKNSLYLFNTQTKLPVTGAHISGSKQGIGVFTDDIGRASLSDISGDILMISSVGYATKIITKKELPADGKVMLEPAITSLAEIQVNTVARTGIFRTISDLDIHLRPIINSQEALRMIPGLFIGQHAGGGKAEQIFLRGFDLDHGTDINITVDGMAVNMVSHAHGQGYADLHFVIPELIDKIDFNKGPYFADKGNFATAGYVAFKTKDYLDNNFLKVEAGQYQTYRAVAGLNLLKKVTEKDHSQSLYLAGEASFTNGYFESPQHFNRYNGILKYHGRIGQHSSLTSYISAFSSKWDASGQIPDRAVADGTIGWYGAIDNTEGGKTSRYNINNVLSTTFDNGLRWKNQLYYTRYAFELYSNFTFFLENPVDGDQIKQKEQRNLLGYISSVEKDHHLFNREATFSAGVQTRLDATKGSELSNTKNRKEVLDQHMYGDITEFNGGVFAEEKLFLSSKLTLTAGLRGDVFTNRYKDLLLDTTLSAKAYMISPKLNFNYQVNKNVQLYLYTGKGFHSNDTRVAVVQDGREVVTPAWGSDLGGLFRLSDKIMLQTALWYLWMQQEFVYVGDAGVVEPSGRTRRFGWDVGLRYEIIKSLYADIDANVAHPRALGVNKGEDRLPLAPVFTSTGGITYRKLSGINGSIRYRYMADRPANESNSVVAEGYLIFDAAVNYTRRKWEAGITIQNILNTKWKETQFDTESRLYNEAAPVSEIHFTPGTPFFLRGSFTFFF